VFLVYSDWVLRITSVNGYSDGDGLSNRSPKLSLGFATLAGDPPGLTPRDLPSNIDTPEGPGPNGVKASGLLMVSSRMYLFVRNYRPDGGSDYAHSRNTA
jgi:hypothetical protein